MKITLSTAVAEAIRDAVKRRKEAALQRMRNNCDCESPSSITRLRGEPPCGKCEYFHLLSNTDKRTSLIKKWMEKST